MKLKVIRNEIQKTGVIVFGIFVVGNNSPLIYEYFLGDPMHGILKTLGPASLSSLHGAATEDCGSLTALGRTEVCLVLNPVGGTKMGKVKNCY